MLIILKFIAMVLKIKSLKPTYKQPGDGSDGTCDCIGLIIGALRRAGIKWTGIHGSNYAARYQTINLHRITSESGLEVGDIVYKAYEPGESKYKLPDRYKPGNSYYNGDLKDYYHVGVVTQINPLNITHMTSPTVKVDTKLGKWGYSGKCKPLMEAAGKEVQQELPVITEPVATPNATAVVTAPKGKYVKMRAKPSKLCALYDEVPIGATVTILEPGEEWAKICYGRRKGWYMQAQYLTIK